MTCHRNAGRCSQHGQTLVLMVLALVALLAATGLVIDGGNAFAQQRITQNAVDSTAEAGATALSEDLAAQAVGQSPLPQTDQNVLIAVNNAASFNGVAAPVAYYTTVKGRCILSDGSTAAPPCSSQPNAVKVGSGSIPTVAYDATNGGQQCPIPPGDDPATTPALACGVAVFGSRSFRTYAAGAIGITKLSASAQATAVAGAVTGVCAGDVSCGFLPLTIPTSVSTCDNTNKWSYGQGPYVPISTPPGPVASNEVIIPVCGTGPGSVGWLAIQPEDGNGTTDLVNDVTTPDNPPIYLPSWINAETGNTNDAGLDTAVNGYDGQVVLLPLYDCTADVKVVGGQQNPATSPALCSGLTSQQLNGGTGSGLYYHLYQVVPFLLDKAYLNGNPKIDGTRACDGGNPPDNPGITPSGGNGATGCLKGWFISEQYGPGVVVGLGSGQTPSTSFGVQLIR